MSIREIQIEKALEKIVRAALQKGKHPRLREAMREADLSKLGMPNSYSDMAGFGNLLTSKEVNKSLSQYEEDFSILDESIIESEKWTSSIKDTLLGRYSSAQSLYEKLALQVTAMALAVKSGTNSVYTLTEGFSTLENVDLNNTDAYVDTSIGHVSLPRAANILSTFEYGSGIGLLSCEMSTDGNTWQNVASINKLSPIIEFPSYQGKLQIKYVFKLQAKQPLKDDECNVASLEFSVPTFREYPNSISLKVSDDGKNWRELSNLGRGNKLSFIPSDPFEYIEIVISKTTYDQMHVTPRGTISYLYLPYIESFLARAYTYQHSATLQTLPMSIASVAQSLGLSALQFIPYHITPGESTISYYIQFDSGPWTKINAGDTVALARNYVKDEILYPVYPNAGIGNTTQIWANLKRPSEAELFEGYNQAEHQWLAATSGFFDLDSWADASALYTIPTNFIDFKNKPLLASGYTHKLYFKIKSDKEMDFEFSNISFKRESDLSNVPSTTKIWLNNKEIILKSYADFSYSFSGKLSQGDNYFNLLTSVSEDAILHLEEDILNKGFIYINNYIYTSISNLINKTLPFPFLKLSNYLFTITDNGYLFINRYPYPNPKYLLRYRDIEGTIPSTVSIKAILEGNDTDSPILDDFTLLISEPVGW